MCWFVSQGVGTKQCNKGSQGAVSEVDVLIMAHNEGPCLPLCASTQQQWRPTQTHTDTHICMHTHTYPGQAAARLSSPKIIRHQNEFSCFFSFFPPPPLFVLFMCWNSGDWLMQLTCSHHEFSLRHYMATLQERGSWCYNDAINMHA